MLLLDNAARDVRPPTAILRRAWTILRTEGWIALWFRVLGETVYRRVLLVELDLPPRPDPPKGIEARWLRAEEASAYAAFHPALSAAEVRRRLAAGERCLVLESEGRMVHGRWCATARAWIEYLQVFLPLPPGAAYVYQSFTPPAERGHGYATAGAVAGGQALHREGFNRTIGCIQPDRAMAYPPIFKAGYRPAGYLGWYRLGWWRIPFRTRTARFPRYAPHPWTAQPGYWDSVGSGATNSYLDWFLARLKRREHLALIRRWGGIPGRGRVLKTDLFEEANGSDRLLDALHSEGTSAFGIDVSPAIAAVAARLARAEGRCAATDVRRLPFVGETFDLVVSPSTLDHFARSSSWRSPDRHARQQGQRHRSTVAAGLEFAAHALLPGALLHRCRTRAGSGSSRIPRPGYGLDPARAAPGAGRRGEAFPLAGLGPLRALGPPAVVAGASSPWQPPASADWRLRRRAGETSGFEIIPVEP